MIDKDIQQFAVLNMMAAIVSSPHAFAAAQQTAKDRATPIEVAVRDLATSLAVAGLKQVDQTDFFQLPTGSPASDALQLFLDVSSNPRMRAFEDTLQEGELASNAAALLLGDGGFWHGAQPDSEELVPFPGTGDAAGPGRINDLIRAAALTLAEAGRIERLMDRENTYADARRSDGATAVIPGDHDPAAEAMAEAVLGTEGEAKAVDPDPNTRH